MFEKPENTNKQRKQFQETTRTKHVRTTCVSKHVFSNKSKTRVIENHVPKKNIKGGLIHDYVLIKILKNKRRVNEGVVEKIIKRDKEFFVGTFSKKNNTKQNFLKKTNFYNFFSKI